MPSNSEQPNTTQVNLAEGGNTAPCGDEAVERDAARYRFVRELLGPGQKTRQWFHFVGLAAAAPDTAEGFDAAVDATMKGQA